MPARFMPNSDNQAIKLPRMRLVRQHFNAAAKADIKAQIDEQWPVVRRQLNLPGGSTIAVCVGSRGIVDLAEIVRTVVARLKQIGLKPFITSAMGSHGGGCAEGQAKILAGLGINETGVGAPIRVSMDVVCLGRQEGISLYFDKLAYEADGIVVINRIKAHTDFVGPTESGLIKMLAVGLGNRVGAEYCHRSAIEMDMYEVVSRVGRALIDKAPVLFGVGIVENVEHQISALRLIQPQDIERTEIELLKQAKENMPGLPLDEVDLLIVDEIGKEISGAGLDPIVTGRVPGIFAMQREHPKVTRIFIRDLTAASKGNAIGIGQADFTTQRLVEKIDKAATAVNCIAGCCPEEAKIPIACGNDRDAILSAVATIRPCPVAELKIVRIKNTRDLEEIYISEACESHLKKEVAGQTEYAPFDFDDDGNLRAKGW